MKQIIFVFSLIGFSLSIFGQDAQDLRINLSTGNFELPLLSPESQSEPQDENSYFDASYFRVIQFAQLPTTEQRNQWSSQGMELVDYIPNAAYFAVIRRGFDLRLLDNIRSIIPVDERFKVEADMYFNGIPSHALIGSDQAQLVVSYYRGLDFEKVRQALAGFGEIIEHRSYAFQFDIIVDLDKVDPIIDLPYIQFVGPRDPDPTLEAGFWRGTGRTNYVNSGYNGLSFTGRGVAVAVGEGGMIGVDDIDFKGRITEMHSGSTGGHKYGVSLRAAGAGNTNPRNKGMAPGAKFYSLGYSPDYGSLYNSDGIRFTNHSLGYGINGSYSSSARSRDLFVVDHPAGMVQYSAGNSGGSTGYAPYNTFSGWGNITGTRKQFKNNLLAASCNASDNVTGFTSRGPTYDGRVAPHMIIEGSGGTSHAAPKMIGNFAVLSEIYTSFNPGLEASSSLLKAVLMNTTDDLDIPGIDFKTGYGRVNMRRAHDLIADGNIITSSVDQGNRNTHSINVPPNVKELRVLVYWADEPAVVNAATALVNDIDLMVNTPSNNRFLPWVLDHTPNASTLSNQATRQEDHLNNVEQVSIENPTSGMYAINITGHNIPVGPQEYHLVYEFLEEHIQLTDPIKNEKLIPGENYYIYWDAYTNSTANFQLDYQLAGGSWVNIANNINSNEREYNWTVPNLGQGIQNIKFRITQAGLSSESDNNTIGVVPNNIEVLAHCSDTLILTWDPVPGATGYVAYILDSINMVEQVNNAIYSGDSVKIGGLNNAETIYFAVAAKTGNYIGQRSNAQISSYQIDVPAEIVFSNKQFGMCAEEVVSYDISFCTQNPMTIVPSEGFLVSLSDNTGFMDTLVIVPGNFGLDHTIYVRLDSSVLNREGVFSGFISHTSTGISPFDLPITPFEFSSIKDRSTYAAEALENGEYMEIQGLNWNNPDNFTIEWWLMPYSYNNYNQQIGNGWGNFLFHANNNGSFSVGVANNGSRINSGSILIDLNKWQHFAFVKEGNNFAMYKNGQLVGTSTSSSNVNWTNFLIGQSGGNSINGRIDEFRIWETARSISEIRKNMHLTLTGLEMGLRVYLQFNAQSGSVVDYGPNCYTITNSGFSRVPSELAVAGGYSVQQSINSNGLMSFHDSNGDTYLDIDFKGSVPNGDIVVSHLRSEAPHGNIPPSSVEIMNEYWIVNNYGSVNSGLEADLLFHLPGQVESPIASNYMLSKRPDNEVGIWEFTNPAVNVDVNNDALVFDRIGSFSQFVISKPSEADSLPGSALLLQNDNDYGSISSMDLNTDSLTISAWVKPIGGQNDWAGIVFCRGGNTIAGLSVRNTNELRYHWNGGEWDYSTGMFLNPEEWNHVALVITPNQMRMYVNGEEHVRNRNHGLEEFNGEVRIGNDAAGASRTFRGEIDEVVIWDRVLELEELRLQRHLTKDDLVQSDPNLKAYYQFNNQVNRAYDQSGNARHASFNGGASKVLSNGPFGGGSCESLTINGPGFYTSGEDVDFDFTVGGNIPNGDLYITKLNVTPNVLPSAKPMSQSYWIINNYTAEQNISGLDVLKLINSGLLTPGVNKEELWLYQRSDNSFETWDLLGSSDTVEVENDVLSFGQSASITSLGQFVILHEDAKGWIGVQNTDWHNPNNWGEHIIPGNGDNVIIPAGTPYQPIVEANASIRSLVLQQKATLDVLNSVIFTMLKP